MRYLIAILLAASFGAEATAADWLQFRGPAHASTTADDTVPPVSFDLASGENVAFATDLPGRGTSSPIVVGDRIVLTASSGYREDQFHVLAYDFASGTAVWKRTFQAMGPTFCHPKMAIATPTPASDGESIFAFYSSNDLFCLDLDGNLRWLRALTLDYVNASNSVGMSSSPVVAGDTLVVQVENDTNSFAAGIDVATGQNRWKIARPRRVNWTSPVWLPDARGKEKGLVLLQSMEGISAVDPATGDEIWSWTGRMGAIPSTTPHAGVLYAPGDGVVALDAASGAERWTSSRLRTGTASFVVHADRLFGLANPILKCASLEDGELAWQLRLDGQFSATPAAAGGHLWTMSEAGLCQVVRIGEEEGSIVATSDFGETILASPVIVRGSLIVRSDAHLWRIAAESGS